MTDVARLQSHLRELGRFLLGYSGGVDSAVLAVAATRAVGAENFLAVIGKSASYPDSQYRTALELAHRFGIPLRELVTHELEDPRYVANPVNRCYFCKTELWDRLTTLAHSEGFSAIIDGTNADDGLEHRPGRAAAAEWKVRSPLAKLGFTKAQVRGMARELELPTWNAPASPCLSSRIKYGMPVTPERLGQIEAAEVFLRECGIEGDLRVRHLGDRALVEVAPDQFGRVDARWDDVVATLRGFGFRSVERSPQGYRRGSLLVLAQAAG